MQAGLATEDRFYVLERGYILPGLIIPGSWRQQDSQNLDYGSGTARVCLMFSR